MRCGRLEDVPESWLPVAPPADLATSFAIERFRVVAEAGRREIDEPALRDAFARAYGHDVAEAIAAELEAFLTELRSAA